MRPLPSVHAAAALGVTVAIAACRADPGDPDPLRLGPVTPPESLDEDALPGPDPYVAGEDRLSLGVFYEGGASAVLPPGPSIHYYIYVEATSGGLTYAQVRVSDRVEGRFADRLLHGGKAWWGGGVHFDVAQDLRAWTTLHLSLKSSSATFDKINVGMNSDGAVETVDAADYGWAADGQWHAIAIPTADLADLGVDLGAVTAGLTLGGGAGTSADSLQIDDVYFSAE